MWLNKMQMSSNWWFLWNEIAHHTCIFYRTQNMAHKSWCRKGFVHSRKEPITTKKVGYLNFQHSHKLKLIRSKSKNTENRTIQGKTDGTPLSNFANFRVTNVNQVSWNKPQSLVFSPNHIRKKRIILLLYSEFSTKLWLNTISIL